MDNIWYEQYDSLREKVSHLKNLFADRCRVIGVSENKVLEEFSQDFLTRAVHESNWQEGLELGIGKTQELANLAFDEIEDIFGPHLDMNKILRFHRNGVSQLKKTGASEQEIGAYNLARAYHAIKWVGTELATRQAASLGQALRGLRDVFEERQDKLTSDEIASIEKMYRLLDEIEKNPNPVTIPMTAPPATEGALASNLLALESKHLLFPMRSAYVHFFHRLIMMGIIAPSKLGRFRTSSVHVGNYNLFFPAPSSLQGLMKEFCHNFPTILPNTVKYDAIIEAAKASHRFVSIHPYVDGNGRVSRVLMNLVLWGHFPPVYLKADKKGRHRYGQALKRADNGNIEPLGSSLFWVGVASPLRSAAPHPVPFKNPPKQVSMGF